jgi:NAD(P)-dependent dehydrogenase (short-subunit alcohol dehydrogenase family)
MKSLLNKGAIVTGTSSGFGFETAKLFAKEGAKVLVGARRKEESDLLVSEIVKSGGEAIALAGDVKDDKYSKELVSMSIKSYGGLDIAFNNAGDLGAGGALGDMSLEQWDDTINTNECHYWREVSNSSNRKNSWGSMIFTSTFVGYNVGLPGMAAYAASMSGLVGLTQSLAAKYGPMGIRVNSLLPGGADTPMVRSFLSSLESLKFVLNLHALKRIVSPAEMAKPALYLASDASSFTTGSAMLADGGVSISRT